MHLRIHGLVQGVSFRASAQEKARTLGVSGWVRNAPGGDVEAVADGPQAAIEAFVAWCHHGPEEDRVERVTVSEPGPEGSFSQFEVRR